MLWKLRSSRLMDIRRCIKTLASAHALLLSTYRIQKDRKMEVEFGEAGSTGVFLWFTMARPKPACPEQSKKGQMAGMGDRNRLRAMADWSTVDKIGLFELFQIAGTNY